MIKISLLFSLLSVACVALVREHPLSLRPPVLEQGAAVDPEALYQSGNLEIEAAKLAAQRASGAGLHEALAYLAWLSADTKTFVSELSLAARDKSSPNTELYLREIAAATLTEGERAGFASLLEALRTKHPRPEVRAFAAQELASLEIVQGDIERARALIAPLAFVRDWQLIGGFDNDEGKGFGTVYPPETELRLDGVYQGAVRPERWRSVPMMTWLGAVPISEFVHPAASVSYLVTWLRVDAETTAVLHLTTPEPVVTWLNDTQVLSEQHLRGGGIDNLKAGVVLKRGWNRLLVKSAALHNAAVSVRFSGEDGVPLVLVASAVPPTASAATTTSTHATESATAPATPRELWLRGREQMHEGLRDQAAATFKALLELAPKNDLARVGAALALWDKDELERALDLLMVSQSPLAAVKRARFHISKRFWDDARRDLDAALQQARDDRLARQEEASLFESRGQTFERCRLLDDTVKAWPDWSWAVRELSSCLQGRGYRARANALIERLQAQAPGNSTLIDRLLSAARDRDEKLESSFLQRLRELQPWSVAQLLASADFERRRGRSDKAREFLEQAVTLNPDLPEPYERLGDLAFEARSSNATHFYELALERDPKNVALSERLGSGDKSALAALAPSAADIAKIIAHKSEVEVLPGSQVLILLDHDVVDIAQDGSTHHIETSVSQGLDEQGRDRIIEHHLARGARLRIAYALTPEGERQEAASVSDSAVRFRKLAVGSIVVLQDEYWTEPHGFLPNHASETFWFQQAREQNESPTWRVLSPRPLNILLRGQVKRTSAPHGDKTLYEFSAHHVPPLQPEPLMPPAQDLLWQASVSTVSGWDEFVRWEQSLIAEAYRVSPEVDALAHRLTKDAKTTGEKLDALFAYVAKDVRYQMDYETNIAGVRPHACPVVIERGYGDCKDKALLLVALGSAVGLDLRFALLRTREYGDAQRDVPNQQFNHAIVYVPVQLGMRAPLFLDATAEDLDFGNLPPSDQGALALVFSIAKEGFEFITIPMRPGAEEREQSFIDIRVDDAGHATAKQTSEFRGLAGALLRKTLREKKLAEKFYQGLLAREFTGGRIALASAEHVDDLSAPVVVHLDADLSGSIHDEEDHQRLTLPSLYSVGAATQLAERLTPLRFGALQDVHEMTRIHLGKKLRVIRAPKAFALGHPCLSAKRTVEKKDSDLTISVDIERRCFEALPSDYPGLRRVLEQVSQQLEDPLAFGGTSSR